MRPSPRAPRALLAAALPALCAAPLAAQWVMEAPSRVSPGQPIPLRILMDKGIRPPALKVRVHRERAHPLDSAAWDFGEPFMASPDAYRNGGTAGQSFSPTFPWGSVSHGHSVRPQEPGFQLLRQVALPLRNVETRDENGRMPHEGRWEARLPALEPGFYLLELELLGFRATLACQVSDLVLLLEGQGLEGRARVFSASTGEALPAATLLTDAWPSSSPTVHGMRTDGSLVLSSSEHSYSHVVALRGKEAAYARLQAPARTDSFHAPPYVLLDTQTVRPGEELALRVFLAPGAPAPETFTVTPPEPARVLKGRLHPCPGQPRVLLGRFRILPAAPAGGYTLSLGGPHGGYDYQWFHVLPSANPLPRVHVPQEFTLETSPRLPRPGEPFQVRASSPEGWPLEDLRVACYRAGPSDADKSWSYHQEPPPQPLETRTGPGATFTLEAGVYLLRAQARGPRGEEEVRGGRYLAVGGQELPPARVLQALLDEGAGRAQVRLPRPGMLLRWTFDDGKTAHRGETRLAGRSALLDLEVPPGLPPGSSLILETLDGEQRQYVRFPSLVAASRLQVGLRQEGPAPQPGGPARLALEVSDARGRAVPAQVFLSVTEQARLTHWNQAFDPLAALHPGILPAAWTFASGREQSSEEAKQAGLQQMWAPGSPREPHGGARGGTQSERSERAVPPRSCQAPGPDWGTLEGRILDTAGRPLAGARVEISNGRLLNDRSCDTGLDGSWRVPALPGGTYRVACRAWGHAERVFPQVKVQPGAVERRDAVLKPLPKGLLGDGPTGPHPVAMALSLAGGPIPPEPVRTLDALEDLGPQLPPGTLLKVEASTPVDLPMPAAGRIWRVRAVALAEDGRMGTANLIVLAAGEDGRKTQAGR